MLPRKAGNHTLRQDLILKVTAHVHKNWSTLANGSSTERPCDLCFCFLLSLLLLFFPPFIPTLSGSSLTFILRGCLQGCVRQALLSALPPSSAPLSLGLTVMNERNTEGREKRTDEDEGGCRFCWRNDGKKRGQQIRVRERCSLNRNGWRDDWNANSHEQACRHLLSLH